MWTLGEWSCRASVATAAFMRSNAPLTINPSGRFQMKAQDSDLLSGFPD